MDVIWTVKQVAERFHVSADVVRRMLNEGRLQGKRVGRSWQIPQQAIINKIKEDNVWDCYGLDLTPSHLTMTLEGYRGRERVRDYLRIETDMLDEGKVAGFEDFLPVSFWTKFADILPQGEPWDDIRKKITRAIEEGQTLRKEIKAEEDKAITEGREPPGRIPLIRTGKAAQLFDKRPY